MCSSPRHIAAYHDLHRLSGAKASTTGPYSLDHTILSKTNKASQANATSTSGSPDSAFCIQSVRSYILYTPLTRKAVCTFLQYLLLIPLKKIIELSKNYKIEEPSRAVNDSGGIHHPVPIFCFVEVRGFEPLTYCVQGNCSPG